MAKKRNYSIFPVKWEPRKGGLKSDIDPESLANGDLYVTGPETGGLNIRMTGKGTNVSPSYEPMVADKLSYTLAALAVQVKKFRLNIDITNWAVATAATISWDVDTPSAFTLGSVSNVEAVPVTIGTLMTNIIAQIAALGTLSPTTAQTTVDADNGYIDFYFDAPLYLNFKISNLATTNVGIVLALETTQEAIDQSMVGEWHLLGSDDRTGDCWQWWTTRKGLPVELNITGVSNTGGEFEVDTTVAHGLVTDQSVQIKNVLDATMGANINGVWTVTALTTTTFLLNGSTFAGAYTGATGLLISNIVGYGQIGVAVRDDNAETVAYTRLLASRKFNFSTLKQVDCRVKKKQDGSTAAYWLDMKFNLPKVFYYKGAFVTDGGLKSINSENIYEYGSISSELTWQLTTNGEIIRVFGQLQSGGGLYSGNWRYSGRFLTSNLSGTDYLLMTNTIPVYDAAFSASAIGDEENTITNKVNQIEIVNPNVDLFKFFELIAINYIGDTPRAYYVGRTELNDNSNIILNHTGLETTLEDFDFGLLNSVTSGFLTGQNIEMINNRATISNLVPASRVDFTDFVATFRYRLQIEQIPTVGEYTNFLPDLGEGEYADPMNAYGKRSFMMHETYRAGFMFKIKQTGTWTEVFYYKDITIDLPPGLPANGRDVGTFVSFDVTNAGQTLVNSVYIDFNGFDLDFEIDGIPVRDLISEIQPVFVKVNPSIYSGIGIIGVSGIVQEGGGLRVAFYNDTEITPYDTGPFPWACGTALAGNLGFQPGTFTGIVPIDDASYTLAADGATYFTPVREAVFMFVPDLIWDQLAISFSENSDEIISCGYNTRSTPFHGVPVSGPPGTGWPPNYAEFEGFNNITTNAGREFIVVKKAVMATRGQAEITELPVGFPLWHYSLRFVCDLGNYVSPPDITDTRAVEKCAAMELNAPVTSQGIGGVDYGVYQMWYKINLVDQYGPIDSNVYENWGEPFVVGDLTGVVAVGSIEVYGDVFNQKTYSVFMYPAADGYQMASGMGFYSQNRMNTQMKRKATPTSVAIVPQIPLDSWIGLNRSYSNVYPQLPDGQLNYNKGYTPQNYIRSFRAFDDDLVFQKDWSNAVAWTNIEVTGSSVDDLRYFPPLNIKFLDYTDGAITSSLNLNNEFVTFQERRILRQFFDTSNMLSTVQGAEVVIGDGTVMGRKGQTMTQYGCKNKWSVIVGLSEKGHDVVYYFDSVNKALCRIGYDGTNSISMINGMQSFFANYTKFIIGKDSPADDEGICGVANQRYRDIFMTFRGRKSGVQVWDATKGYLAGAVVQYTPAVFSDFFDFHQTGEFYTAVTSTTGVIPEGNPDDWQLIPHTNGDYYNEYTIIWNEIKNEFQMFWSGKPRIYARISDSVLVPRPISNSGTVFELNDGTGVTQWFNDGVTSLQGRSFFDGIINAPEGRKGLVAIRVVSNNNPDRVEIFTNQHATYIESGDFEQREGNEFDSTVFNDIGITAANPGGINKADTSKLFGRYAIIRLIMFAGNYNLWDSFILKVKQRARQFMK